MKYLIIFLIIISTNCFSQVKQIIFEGDTLYAMSKEDFNKFYDLLIDLDVCKKNDSLTNIQLKVRELQIFYLRDSVLNATNKIDSLNEQIIQNLNKKTKPKLFEIKGLFLEGSFLYNPIDSGKYYDLGLNFKTIFNNFLEISPGIKTFWYKNKFNLGIFLRSELKIY
jgi:hypothetical protein